MKEDPFKELNDLNKEILAFNFDLSLEEQKKEVQRLAQKVIDINNTLPVGTIAELGGDTVSLVSCAIKPADVIACLWAIVAVLDIIKVVKQKKFK